MDLDAIIARYFNNSHVRDWLLTTTPVRQVTASALRNAFAYSIGFGRKAVENATVDVEDMLIVCSTPSHFICGVVWGVSYLYFCSSSSHF